MSCEIKNGPAAHSLKGLKGQPSKWLERFSRLFPKNAKVLDLACGCGRNTKYLSKMGYEVTAVDWDERVRPYVADLPGGTFKQVDLENGTWAFEPEAFDVILVNFYLYRPILSFLPSSLVPGGYLLYETFMMPYLGFDGNRAKNCDFILNPLELVDTYRNTMAVLAYEETLSEKGDCFQKILCKKPIDGKNLPVALYDYENLLKI